MIVGKLILTVLHNKLESNSESTQPEVSIKMQGKNYCYLFFTKFACVLDANVAEEANLTLLSMPPFIMIVSPSKSDVKFNHESICSFMLSDFASSLVQIIMFLPMFDEIIFVRICFTLFTY